MSSARSAFNVWFDQRPKDTMPDDLFRRLRTLVAPPAATTLNASGLYTSHGL